MRSFNSLILVTTAITLPLTAQAADLTMRPIYKAPSVWTWSGFYIGLNAGGSVGMNRRRRVLRLHLQRLARTGF
jgi:hypothetical protein